jgi:hypothetical protein
MADEGWFDFREELGCTEWIDALPRGLISPRINLQHNSVNVQQTESGYSIYVGPMDPDAGGDALIIQLDTHLALVDYEIERLAPLPPPGP